MSCCSIVGFLSMFCHARFVGIVTSSDAPEPSAEAVRPGRTAARADRGGTQTRAAAWRGQHRSAARGLAGLLTAEHSRKTTTPTSSTSRGLIMTDQRAYLRFSLGQSGFVVFKDEVRFFGKSWDLGRRSVPRAPVAWRNPGQARFVSNRPRCERWRSRLGAIRTLVIVG